MTELLRLFQASGQIHYEATPVIKGKYSDLDFARVNGFFAFNQINTIDILGLAKRTTINWINRLINKNLVEPTSESRNDPNCKYKIRG